MDQTEILSGVDSLYSRSPNLRLGVLSGARAASTKKIDTLFNSTIMPPAAVKPVAPRKRNRKRKRRAASESSSSSSSSDSDSDEEQTKPPVAKQIVQPEESSSESSDTSSESESEHEAPVTTVSSTTARKSIPSKKPQIVRRTPSPSPPPSKIPDFINSKVSENKDAQEQIMKDKFRRFWMTSVADGFKDDLEEIRKVCYSWLFYKAKLAIDILTRNKTLVLPDYHY